MNEYKYTDKNHPPVPQLKVGDICYTFCDFGRKYDYVSKCEIRKVAVLWRQYSDYEKEHYDREDHWEIEYYIRILYGWGDKSAKLIPYCLGDDGRKPNLFLTPQEVMDINIRDFKEMVIKNIKSMQETMFGLGYTKEMTQKLLEYNIEEK